MVNILDFPDKSSTDGGSPTRLAVEIGTDTPEYVRGTLYQDYHPRLRGTRALRIYEEMTNDATIGSILHAINMLLRGLKWGVHLEEPKDPESIRAGKLLEGELAQLEHTWQDFIDQAASSLPYGFSWFETVYRIDQTDGHIGWEKFSFRPQRTLIEWLWVGRTLWGFRQSIGDGQTVDIPLHKSVHFRPTTATTAPEGRSILRTMYRTYHFKKRAEEFMMIGLERDMDGIPKAGVPTDVLARGSGDAVYDAIKNVVTRTKQHQQHGILWPNDRDPDTGEPLYELDILQHSGRPKVDPIQVQRLLATDMASAVLAQFIMLGRDAVGSRALATPQQELFQAALTGWSDSFQQAFHMQATKRLFALNGIDPNIPVTYRHSGVKETDLMSLGQFLQAAGAAGIPLWSGDPDDPIINEVREIAGLDPIPKSMSIEMPPVIGGASNNPGESNGREQGTDVQS